MMIFPILFICVFLFMPNTPQYYIKSRRIDVSDTIYISAFRLLHFKFALTGSRKILKILSQLQIMYSRRTTNRTQSYVSHSKTKRGCWETKAVWFLYVPSRMYPYVCNPSNVKLNTQNRNFYPGNDHLTMKLFMNFQLINQRSKLCSLVQYWWLWVSSVDRSF